MNETASRNDNVTDNESRNDDVTTDNESRNDEDDDEIVDNEEIYEGSYNVNGERHGRGTLYFGKHRNNFFRGRFEHGEKCGKGCFYFADGSTLAGYFFKDSLNGKGIYTSCDGSIEVSQYTDGELCGKSEAFDADGFLNSKGTYRDNIRIGSWSFYSQYGGSLVGLVNKTGQLTGKNIIYIYPDAETILKGEFKDGDMVNASIAKHDGVGDKENPHSYKKLNTGVTYCRDVSTYTTISDTPMIPDPFEEKRVYVGKSTIEGAGEGLFAKVNASAGEVMSFYNGVRVPHAEVDARDWSENDNTISLDSEIVIDVPSRWSRTSEYRASLGHKANHSFQPNCKYDRFEHPRFGSIKCIRTIQNVAEGEELTVAYGYDHSKLDTDAPDWYKRKLKIWENNKLI